MPLVPVASYVPLLGLLLSLTCSSCSSGGGDSGTGGAGRTGSNRARFTFDVDLQGVVAVLVMDVEVVNATGVTWGPGVSPDITGVIATGDTTIFTAGELRSPTARYVFTGENRFADFTETNTLERFRVEWVETDTGLRMIVNLFGPGPVQYDCVLTASTVL